MQDVSPMKLMNFIVWLVLIASISTCRAQELWSETSVGMTEDEVKAIVPNAVKPENPSTIEGGATELLRLEGVEVEKIPFNALFYFKEGKLLQVTLTVIDRRKFQDSLDRI
jgi:hypothetical protein